MKSARFFLTPAFFAVCLNLANAQVLEVPQKYQEKSQWCWAATSQAVLAYYGIDKTQTEIAQYGTEGQDIWNWLYGQTSNPTRRGVNLILHHFSGIESVGLSSTLGIPELKDLLSENKAVPLRWGWDSGGGHILVLRGVSDSTVYLMDPLYGPTVQKYSWLQRGGSHTWTHTLKLLSIPTAVDEPETPLPVRFRLEANYPNPFNATTVVRYSLPTAQPISLAVFDLQGKVVTTLFRGVQTAGTHTILWNAERYPSGIYFLVLQGESVRLTRKMVLQK